MDFGDDIDGVTLLDTYKDDIDMIDIGRILDAVPHKPHYAFDILEFLLFM